MSHELRTPLTLIMAPLKRMLSSIGPEHPDYNTLNRIYRQSRRMKDLLNMALDLRKMEVGKSAMKMENSINADKDGKVAAINVSKGESVLEGTDLVIIE